MKNNKILLVLASNIHWAPYYYKYEKILNENKIKFDLLIWNRENIEESVTASNLIEYKLKDVSNNKNPFKLFKFIRFSCFAKKTIEKNNYNKIVFLGTHGCAPAFLAKFLAKKFKHNYWLDIRDYQYEWFKPYYLLEKKCIFNSYATCISSKGYEKFLPKFKYNYIHNIDPNMDEILKKYKKVDSEKIRISFIGNVRYYEENIKLIKLLGNDNRFMLQYYGAGSDILEKYCKDKKITNADFHGKFSMNETINFYNKTDIINNIYGNDSIALTTALSNKLYYSLYFNLPILVCQNTYMSELTKKYKIGIEFNDNKEFADKLYEFYKEFNSTKSNYLKTIFEKEEIETEKKLIDFLRDN